VSIGKKGKIFVDLTGTNLLLHLDLLFPTLLRVHLRPQSTEILRLLTGIVAFTSDTFTLALIVIESLSVPMVERLAM
jgi:hypothetical protein